MPARQPGDGKLKPIEDAPGSYVKVRAEDRRFAASGRPAKGSRLPNPKLFAAPQPRRADLVPVEVRSA